MIAQRIKLDRFQVGTLLVFLGVNLSLLALAQPVVFDGQLTHTAYAFAPDGTRYWHPALSLLHDGTFSYFTADGQAHPLAKGGPIPPLFFSFFIKVFGFHHAPYFFIPAQCALLFSIGLLARRVAEIFGANKNLVQALIVLNPNLIGIAHFAQSEMLYSFFIAVLITSVIGMMADKSCKSLVKTCLLIGCISAVAVLTRPQGFFFALILPFFLAFTYGLTHRQSLRKELRDVTLIVFIIVISSAIVMAPWAIRNESIFGSFSLMQGSEAQIKDSLARMLVKNGVETEASARAMLNSQLQTIANEHNLEGACIDGHAAPSITEKSCGWQKIEAYVRLIAAQPLAFIIKGLAFAAVSTYFAGGATAISNIVGLDHGSEKIDSSEFSGDGFTGLLSSIQTDHQAYFFILLAAGLFASLCRLVGFLGVIRALKSRALLGPNLFCIGMVLIFSATFLFTGVSRFRAPLEPILMIYAALGIGGLITYFRENPRFQFFFGGK